MNVRTFRCLWSAVAAIGLAAPGASGQSLADYDYENLTFRGVGFDVGHLLIPTRIVPVMTYGVRLDMGYLGPGVRIVGSGTYWSSHFKNEEIAAFDRQLARIIEERTGEEAPDGLSLGSIWRSDVNLTVDAQVVWRIPYGILTHAGVGVGTHILNGGGAGIDGTFVEDLVDSFATGVNVHAGWEYPVLDRFRFFGQARYDVLGDLRYGSVRFGGQLMIKPPVAGEERGR